MATELIPNKAIILIDGSGNIGEALLQYKLSVDGVTAPNFHTVSVLAALDADTLATLALAAINSAKQSEGI